MIEYTEDEDTLLDLAKVDIWLARCGMTSLTGDERELNLVAYHLQQSLEKMMKHVLELHGVHYKATHDLLSLYSKHQELFKGMSEKLVECLSMITTWEAQARYIKGYRTSMLWIEKTFPLVVEYSEYLSKKEASKEIDITSEFS